MKRIFLFAAGIARSLRASVDSLIETYEDIGVPFLAKHKIDVTGLHLPELYTFAGWPFSRISFVVGGLENSTFS